MIACFTLWQNIPNLSLRSKVEHAKVGTGSDNFNIPQNTSTCHTRLHIYPYNVLPNVLHKCKSFILLSCVHAPTEEFTLGFYCVNTSYPMDNC